MIMNDPNNAAKKRHSKCVSTAKIEVSETFPAGQTQRDHFRRCPSYRGAHGENTSDDKGLVKAVDSS